MAVMEKSPPAQPASKTVLVVDDDPGVLNFVASLLTKAHYNVLTANSGPSALQKARDYKAVIDLLLSDFEMPGMNGVDLATRLTAERPLTKVLLMSGFSGGMLVLNEGWHFLAKPFVASQLRALVVGLLSPEKDSRFSAKAH